MFLFPLRLFKESTRKDERGWGVGGGEVTEDSNGRSRLGIGSQARASLQEGAMGVAGQRRERAKTEEKTGLIPY